jgi:bifunctional non-homologous end joining protein LigD
MAKKKNSADIDLSGARKAPFPTSVDPMLATLVDKPFEQDDWLYEVKWDGYRAIAFCGKGNVELVSRNKKSFNQKFYPVVEILKGMELEAVLDGEITVLMNSGVSSFGSLQNWRSEADGELIFYVFDILWYKGYNLKKLPLTRRREILHAILPKSTVIRKSEFFHVKANDFLKAAEKMGLEGVIAKKEDSKYIEGERTQEWLKIKAHRRQEVVIGGYTINENTPKAFSSLLVGVFKNKKLEYTGKIGTGFNVAQQKKLKEAFKPIEIKKCPFEIEPDVNKPSRFRPNPPKAKAVWLKPKLVCEVSFAEMTEDGVMRHPSFEGMREDKSAKDVHEEKPQETEKVIKKVSKGSGLKKGRPAKKPANVFKLKPSNSRERKTLLNPKDKSQVREVSGHTLKFNNLDKIFWSREKFSKRDLLNYYYQVAPYILPYLKDRPQSLNRYPNGIEGKSFYQKDVTEIAPSWVKQFPYHTSLGEDKNYLVVEDEASLLWMANLGAIEMNPWNSTIDNPGNPDWCIIDIDPTEKNSFEQVIKTALVTKDVLDDLQVKGYCKTSGSTGLHIYIPMGAKYKYEECQLFGKLIATRVHNELNSFTSIERLTQNRKGKIYVDYLQNRPKATLAAPYSVRPKPGATVSMPLYWEECKKGLKMKDYTLANAMARIKREGDIFKPVLGKGVNLQKVLGKLQKEAS